MVFLGFFCNLIPKNLLFFCVYLDSEGQSGVICSLFLEWGAIRVSFPDEKPSLKEPKISLLLGFGDLLSVIR